ncbi:MAG: GntR family transcriptional regulator [Planctomycetaceae bacterium]|nr:GntR family transcriptional regulator [Planctomycetaceae bacterium]
MLINVDFNSGEPVTRQVVAQIKWMVATGHLAVGEKLPSVRELASQLKVNPTTVSRIYSELSAEDVIVLRQGQGAFVSSRPSMINRTEAKKQVRELIRRMLSEAVRLGLSHDDIQQLIGSEFENLPENSHE